TTLGLSDQILQGVTATGYTVPTPIQKLAIQPAAEGRDVIGCAQTGTGKTAAFVLPMLHRLATIPHTSQHRPRALVLTPTRELAQQVNDAVTVYGKYLTLRTGTVYGGVGMEPQIKLLRRGVDIIIATPGRLLDHMQRRTIDLSHIQILVLDEADRMLAMGFIQDVRKIVAAVPPQRQTMLFSATFSSEINKLAAGILRNPHRADAGSQQKPLDAIEQNFYMTSPQAKMDLLLHVLEAEKMESVLVFARTKHGADKISTRLERKGIRSTAIHSNRTQPQRQKALDGFREGKFRVLVATDIAARGIDVDGISHVINYDIPRDPEDYLHRIGRTGRAGLSGDAITFVTGEDRDMLRRIERYAGLKATAAAYPDFTPAKHDPAVHEKSEEHVRHARPEHRHARPSGHSRNGRSSGRSGHGERSGRGERSGPSRHATHGGNMHQAAADGNTTNSRPEGSSRHASEPRPLGESRFKKRAFRTGGKKKGEFKFGRKKKPGAKMESFSSDGPWRNH
ncbi:MAG: DEAD/DEAH box helicase, partial [Bacteroidota bacterium]